MASKLLEDLLAIASRAELLMQDVANRAMTLNTPSHFDPVMADLNKIAADIRGAIQNHAVAELVLPVVAEVADELVSAQDQESDVQPETPGYVPHVTEPAPEVPTVEETAPAVAPNDDDELDTSADTVGHPDLAVVETPAAPVDDEAKTQQDTTDAPATDESLTMQPIVPNQTTEDAPTTAVDATPPDAV